MLKAIILAALLFAMPSWAASEGESSGCDSGAPAMIAPDAPEPEHTASREVALRQALDAKGYDSVHFMRDGETIILWGAVPTEADRLMIQTQVFLVARSFSIEDHIQVCPTRASSPRPIWESPPE